MSPVILAVAAILLVALAVVVFKRTHRPDGVAEFQRQIDALSPEARRPVVDQLQQLDDDPDDGPVRGS